MFSNKYFILITLFLSFAAISFSQSNKGKETYFRFSIESKEELLVLTKVVSIDNVSNNEVYAYANPQQLQNILNLGYKIEELPHPGTLYIPEMATTKEEMKDWDNYPSYETYVSMMYQFETDYPGLCQVENIGYSVEGREILFAKISDNVSAEENEPEFMYTATMHGDETCGYILMLRLIDYLLSNYNSDNDIKNLVDNIEIWINPLSNPDGTYAGGNSSVFGATRYNANSVDLNRNFPDPEDGEHPDGNSWQQENIVMMDFADEHSLIHSVNFHGGAEVVNYPWDTWPDLHADDDWYQTISHEYADHCQANSPTGYMDGFDDGTTNGYDWYSISGGRQDYMNYFQYCRESTIELSNTKLVPESQLNAHWNYNKDALIDYIDNVLFGIKGVVTDIYGNPLDAKITLVDHDFDNSEVVTDPDVGDYYRMCASGVYDVLIECEGFFAQTFEDVSVNEESIVVIDAAMQPLPNTPVLVYLDNTASNVAPGDQVSFKIKIQNLGIAPAYNVTGYISTDNPMINITTAQGIFPDLSPQEIAYSSGNFQLEVSEQCPEEYYAEISLYLSCTGFDTSYIFDLAVGVNPILVYDLDGNGNSGPVLRSSLQNLNQDVVYESHNLPFNLNEFGAIFVCLGVYDDNGELSSADETALLNYMNDNGRIYLEGGEAWYGSSGTGLNTHFGVNGISDGSDDTYGVIGCTGSFMDGIAFNYYGDNNYMDHLESVGDAFSVFYNQSPEYFNGIARETDSYKSIGVSFEFGGITSDQRDSVMFRYLEFFDIDTTVTQEIIYTLGDVNNDGEIAVSDIVLTVNFIMATLVPTEIQALAADCNENGMIEVADIVWMVNKILHPGKHGKK